MMPCRSGRVTTNQAVAVGSRALQPMRISCAPHAWRPSCRKMGHTSQTTGTRSSRGGRLLNSIRAERYLALFQMSSTDPRWMSPKSCLRSCVKQQGVTPPPEIDRHAAVEVEAGTVVDVAPLVRERWVSFPEQRIIGHEHVAEVLVAHRRRCHARGDEAEEIDTPFRGELPRSSHLVLVVLEDDELPLDERCVAAKCLPGSEKITHVLEDLLDVTVHPVLLIGLLCDPIQRDRHVLETATDNVPGVDRDRPVEVGADVRGDVVARSIVDDGEDVLVQERLAVIVQRDDEGVALHLVENPSVLVESHDALDPPQLVDSGRAPGAAQLARR